MGHGCVMENEILIEAQAYCDARRISPATLGIYAVNNAHLLKRIEAGRAFPATIQKLRNYMRDNPPA